LFGLQDVAGELRLNRKRSILEKDEVGMTHVYFDQVKEGLPIFKGMVGVHIASDGTISSVNSDLIPNVAASNLWTIPQISPLQVEELVRSEDLARSYTDAACLVDPESCVPPDPDNQRIVTEISSFF
jgi:Zn-dependent metalloprotease